jgi:hypothetical protein
MLMNKAYAFGVTGQLNRVTSERSEPKCLNLDRAAP